MISRWQLNLVACETKATVNVHLEFSPIIRNPYPARSTQVPVWKVTVTECQAVYVVVVLIACASVVEEAPERTSTTSVLVDAEHETIKVCHCVDAIRARCRSTVSYVPDL